MQGGYTGAEVVTLQASKLFIVPLDGGERNLVLISQGEKVPVSFLVLANVSWQYEMLTIRKLSEGYIGTLNYPCNFSVNLKLL